MRVVLCVTSVIVKPGPGPHSEWARFLWRPLGYGIVGHGPSLTQTNFWRKSIRGDATGVSKLPQSGARHSVIAVSQRDLPLPMPKVIVRLLSNNDPNGQNEAHFTNQGLGIAYRGKCKGSCRTCAVHQMYRGFLATLTMTPVTVTPLWPQKESSYTKKCRN